MRISDWSSDVCSSDLGNARRAGAQAVAGMSAYFVYPFAAFCEIAGCFAFWAWWRLDRSALWLLPGLVVLALFAWRSEERRVGKGCVSTGRSWWSPEH